MLNRTLITIYDRESFYQSLLYIRSNLSQYNKFNSKCTITYSSRVAAFSLSLALKKLKYISSNTSLIEKIMKHILCKFLRRRKFNRTLWRILTFLIVFFLFFLLFFCQRKNLHFLHCIKIYIWFNISQINFKRNITFIMPFKFPFYDITCMILQNLIQLIIKQMILDQIENAIISFVFVLGIMYQVGVSIKLFFKHF